MITALALSMWDGKSEGGRQVRNYGVNGSVLSHFHSLILTQLLLCSFTSARIKGFFPVVPLGRQHQARAFVKNCVSSD